MINDDDYQIAESYGEAVYLAAAVLVAFALVCVGVTAGCFASRWLFDNVARPAVVELVD